MAKGKMREATNSPKRASGGSTRQKDSIDKSVRYETNESGVYTTDRNRARDGAVGVTVNAKLNEDGSPANFKLRDSGDIEIKESFTRKRSHS